MTEPSQGRWTIFWAGVKAAALILILAAATLAVFHYREQIWRLFTHFDALKERIVSWGPWGPVAFIALQVAQIVIFFIPGEVTQAAGGAVFGPWLGTLYGFIGAFLGTALAFLLADWLGRPLVKALLKPETFDKVEKLLNARKGFVSVFLLFLIPGMPKDSLCYVAGLTPIHFGWFVLVSSLARIPGILLSAYLGSSLLQQRTGEFLILCGVGLVALILGLVFRKRLHDWMTGGA